MRLPEPFDPIPDRVNIALTKIVNEDTNTPMFPMVADSFADRATAHPAVVEASPLIRIALPSNRTLSEPELR